MRQLMLLPDIIVPEETIVIWENGFSDRDIEEIISVGEMCVFNQGSIGGGSEASTVNSEIRETEVSWIEPNEQSQWLYKRMTELAARVNMDKFQLDLIEFTPLQYSKYKVGGHYDWHVDSGPNIGVHRKLSFVLGLTDPDEYEGGDLEINATGNLNNAVSLRIKKGHLVAFPSYVAHRVTPVTSGQRLTLVGWVIGPKLR